VILSSSAPLQPEDTIQNNVSELSKKQMQIYEEEKQKWDTGIIEGSIC